MLKAPEAFRAISEVAELLGVRQHTLRTWEKRFPFVRPVKRSDGRRYYRPADIEVLRGLKALVDEGHHSVVAIVAMNRTGILQATGSSPTMKEAIGAPRLGSARLRSLLDDLEIASARLTAALQSSGILAAAKADLRLP